MHNVPEKVTGPLWDTIEAFSVYGFNKSHSVSYAIDSYYAGWLHTHYEKEWLATILQSETGNPKALAKAISEIKAIGYKISQVDINYSGTEWTYSEEIQAFVPPLTSVKGLGGAAVDEIMQNRPYKTVNDLLFDESGEWRHSKLNKGCFESLIYVEGLGSLDDFRTGRVKNHKQLHEIIIGRYDDLKKGPTGLGKMALKKWVKEHGKEPDLVADLLSELNDLADWSRVEKIRFAYEILSDVAEDLVFPPEIMRKIEKSNVPPISSLKGGNKGIVWFCAQDIIKKQTKKGKDFILIHAIDNTNNMVKIRVWSQFKEEPQPFTMWLAEVEMDPSWGASSASFKMKRIEV